MHIQTKTDSDDDDDDGDGVDDDDERWLHVLRFAHTCSSSRLMQRILCPMNMMFQVYVYIYMKCPRSWLKTGSKTKKNSRLAVRKFWKQRRLFRWKTFDMTRRARQDDSENYGHTEKSTLKQNTETLTNQYQTMNMSHECCTCVLETELNKTKLN